MVGDPSEYMLNPLETTDEAREDSRLPSSNRFCAATEDAIEPSSLIKLCATDAASSSSVSGEARCLPFPLFFRDLGLVCSRVMSCERPDLAALERVTRGGSEGGDFRLRLRGLPSSCCSASVVCET